MKRALHPTQNRMLTVEGYVQEFGPRLSPAGRRNERPPARCPGCGEDMYPRGEADPKVDSVFAHKPNSTLFCPLKEPAARPYEILPPTSPDLAAAQRLRSSFFLHWKYHWKLLRKYAPFADIDEFIKLIQHSDRQSIWQYRNLQENEIPYVFLVLKDFPPIRNKGEWLRKDWIRFWFDSRVRTLEDLWIRTTGDWRIVKATYATPRAKDVIPGPAQLRSVELPPLDKDFLNAPEPSVHPYQEAQMKKAFPKELGV